MNFKLSFPVNDTIYLKNPESSEIGQKLVKDSIDLINELGFENFTFKKLAAVSNTTEATVYRYFENKHRLLLYIISWYWFYIDYLLELTLEREQNAEFRLKSVIYILTHELPASVGGLDYNKKFLNNIVVKESSKVYLVKDVEEINDNQVFKPFKDLCSKIADIVSAYNPSYKYPKSLSSTILETSHDQQFFADFLPRLTDNESTKTSDYVYDYISDFVSKILK